MDLVGVALVAVVPSILLRLAYLKGHLRSTGRAWSGLVDASLIVTIVFSYIVLPATLYWVFRLARPTSWWAQRFYGSDKLETSRERYWEKVAEIPLITVNLEERHRRLRRLHRSLFGLDRSHVDRYLDSVVEVLRAFEDRRAHVSVPPDLLRRPEFKRTWLGYDKGSVNSLIERAIEDLTRLEWLQRTRPWLLGSL